MAQSTPSLTEEQIAAIIAEYNGGEPADYLDDGEVMDAVTCNETIDDWRNTKDIYWTECRHWKETRINGVDCVEVSGVQIHKGARRRDFIIIANGEKTTTWGI